MTELDTRAIAAIRAAAIATREEAKFDGPPESVEALRGFYAAIPALCDEVDRLRAAIALHRDRVATLGWNTDRKGNKVHGGEWDRELWAALASTGTPLEESRDA